MTRDIDIANLPYVHPLRSGIRWKRQSLLVFATWHDKVVCRNQQQQQVLLL